MQELNRIDSLKLALRYSTSEKHRKSLQKRIAEIENKRKCDVQQSFL
ncbi:MAG: hypothetical protein LKE46_01750 [Clostridium sp.]|jgi:hypothetical protein|nr:hypothetical protein [Clostridium sp.]MCH3962974.1 hypothetical protein [Clostridium sp.]MCI1800183.1 hypothetical protein [Clostridium sp.]MCI2200178.1 hypothetical protein [Clostridium sp.]